MSAKIIPMPLPDIGPVEYNVPRPDNVKLIARKRPKYPFDVMPVGTSFLVTNAAAINVRVAAWHYGMAHNMKFVTRKDGNRIRVWRVL